MGLVDRLVAHGGWGGVMVAAVDCLRLMAAVVMLQPEGGASDELYAGVGSETCWGGDTAGLR